MTCVKQVYLHKNIYRKILPLLIDKKKPDFMRMIRSVRDGISTRFYYKINRLVDSVGMAFKWPFIPIHFVFPFDCAAPLF